MPCPYKYIEVFELAPRLCLGTDVSEALPRKLP